MSGEELLETAAHFSFQNLCDFGTIKHVFCLVYLANPRQAAEIRFSCHAIQLSADSASMLRGCA